MVNGKKVSETSGPIKQKVTRKITHKLLKFNVKGWLNPYINMNNKYRTKDVNRSEKSSWN